MPMLPKLNKSNQPWPELNTKIQGSLWLLGKKSKCLPRCLNLTHNVTSFNIQKYKTAKQILGKKAGFRLKASNQLWSCDSKDPKRNCAETYSLCPLTLKQATFTFLYTEWKPGLELQQQCRRKAADCRVLNWTWSQFSLLWRATHCAFLQRKPAEKGPALMECTV